MSKVSQQEAKEGHVGKVSPEEAEASIIDAISFIQWRQAEDIAKRSGQSLARVRRVLRKLRKGGLLESRGGRYRYENAQE